MAKRVSKKIIRMPRYNIYYKYRYDSKGNILNITRSCKNKKIGIFNIRYFNGLLSYISGYTNHGIIGYYYTYDNNGIATDITMIDRAPVKYCGMDELGRDIMMHHNVTLRFTNDEEGRMITYESICNETYVKQEFTHCELGILSSRKIVGSTNSLYLRDYDFYNKSILRETRWQNDRLDYVCTWNYMNDLQYPDSIIVTYYNDNGNHNYIEELEYIDIPDASEELPINVISENYLDYRIKNLMYKEEIKWQS